MEIDFDGQGMITGCKVVNYLLEKVRRLIVNRVFRGINGLF
jgi:myosin heavy subunit